MLNKLTQKRLKELLHYDPLSGNWTRLKSVTNNGFSCVGRIAGTITDQGYRKIAIDGKKYKSSRLAFLYIEGYFPENIVDHINKKKCDDRWCNLREVSKSCNMRNTKVRANNKSGITGVFWATKDNRWRSYIHYNRKTHSLGDYKNFDNAACARLAGEQCLNWEGCDTSSPAYQYVQKMLYGDNK